MAVPRYELDPDRSRFRITAESSVHGIHATTDGLTGFLELDEDGSSERAAGRLVVPLTALRSGNPLVDRETRRRLDVKRHPEILGELVELSPLGEGRYRARGAITLMGATVDAEGEIRIEQRSGEVGIEGERTFDVRDWGLQPPRLLLLKVDPNVRVRIDLVAHARP